MSKAAAGNFLEPRTFAEGYLIWLVIYQEEAQCLVICLRNFHLQGTTAFTLVTFFIRMNFCQWKVLAQEPSLTSKS